MTYTQMLPTIATALSLALATAAFAADEYNVANGLTLKGNPLGMHGNDPVSMFQDGTPAQGDAALTASHYGIDYDFTSADTQAMFDADPRDSVRSAADFRCPAHDLMRGGKVAAWHAYLNEFLCKKAPFTDAAKNLRR